MTRRIGSISMGTVTNQNPQKPSFARYAGNGSAVQHNIGIIAVGGGTGRRSSSTQRIAAGHGRADDIIYVVCHERMTTSLMRRAT